MEQFYDDDVSDALRQLAEDGFPVSEARREILVPVFSLTDRIRRPPVQSHDTSLDATGDLDESMDK